MQDIFKAVDKIANSLVTPLVWIGDNQELHLVEGGPPWDTTGTLSITLP